MLAQHERWSHLTKHITPSQLCEPFEYVTTDGEARRGVTGLVLQHVVNHATHHRGQISVILTKLGLPAIVLDAPACPEYKLD